MDPDETYRLWWKAVLAENRYDANEHYEALRAWIERGGFEPRAFSNPLARRQFFSHYNPRTGACTG